MIKWAIGALAALAMFAPAARAADEAKPPRQNAPAALEGQTGEKKPQP